MRDTAPRPPLKVLHVIDHLGPGGAQQSLHVLLKNTDQARYPSAVAVLHGDGLYRRRLEDLGLRVYGLSSRRLNPLLPMRLAEVIKSHAPHIVHTHLAVSCIMAAAESLRNKKFHLVSHVRSENQFRFNQAYLKGAHAWANRRAARVIAVSNRVRDFLIDDERVPADRITVIPNSFERMDEQARAARSPRRHFGLGEHDQVAGCCARLDRNKGLEHLIGALHILRDSHPRLRLLLVGEGPDENWLRQQVARLGLGDRVHFAGHIESTGGSGPTVVDALLSMDAFVLPSYFEGFPVSVLEAMALKIPVLCTPVSGIAGTFDDNREILLIPMRDAAATAARLAELLAMDFGSRSALCNSACAKVNDLFAPEKIGGRVAAVYEGLV